jgi:hypothetical protein
MPPAMTESNALQAPRFTVRSAMYCIALIASSGWGLGPRGLWHSAVVLLIWRALFSSSEPWRNTYRLGKALLALGVIMALMWLLPGRPVINLPQPWKMSPVQMERLVSRLVFVTLVALPALHVSRLKQRSGHETRGRMRWPFVVFPILVAAVPTLAALVQAVCPYDVLLVAVYYLTALWLFTTPLVSGIMLIMGHENAERCAAIGACLIWVASWIYVFILDEFAARDLLNTSGW